MSTGFGLIGNGRVLAKVQEDGALTEAFFPSIGFYRHIIQSQFGLFERTSGRSLWLSGREFEARQEYLTDTNVLRTRFRRGALTFLLTDFVHPETHVIVRRLEVANHGPEPVELGIFHMEACSLEENKGNFGYNVAYFDSLRNTVIRYRGHPFDNAVEDPWITEQLQRSISIYATNYLHIHNGSMPQLMIHTNLTTGTLNGQNDLLKILEKQLGLRPGQ